MRTNFSYSRDFICTDHSLSYPKGFGENANSCTFLYQHGNEKIMIIKARGLNSTFLQQCPSLLRMLFLSSKMGTAAIFNGHLCFTYVGSRWRPVQLVDDFAIGQEARVATSLPLQTTVESIGNQNKYAVRTDAYALRFFEDKMEVVAKSQGNRVIATFVRNNAPAGDVRRIISGEVRVDDPERYRSPTYYQLNEENCISITEADSKERNVKDLQVNHMTPECNFPIKSFSSPNIFSGVAMMSSLALPAITQLREIVRYTTAKETVLAGRVTAVRPITPITDWDPFDQLSQLPWDPFKIPPLRKLMNTFISYDHIGNDDNPATRSVFYNWEAREEAERRAATRAASN